MPTIQCKHVDLKKNKDRGIYIYDISDKQKLWLCPDCHMNLAADIMHQLAVEVFLDNSQLKKYDDIQIEEKIDELIEEIEKLKKLKKEDDKDVRKRRKPRKKRGKKSKD